MENKPLKIDKSDETSVLEQYIAGIFQDYGMDKLVDKLKLEYPDQDEETLKQYILGDAENFKCFTDEDLKNIGHIRYLVRKTTIIELNLYF